MPTNVYNAEFRAGDQDAYITGSSQKVGEFLDNGAGFDGTTDCIYVDGTAATDLALSISLGGNATDDQVVFIDATDYSAGTSISLTQSDDNDCVVLENVLTITAPSGTTYDGSGGDTNGSDFGDLTLPIDEDDDEAFTVTFLDASGNMQTMTFESDDEVNLYVDFICFVRGTRIMTKRGEVEVEELEVGDLVITRDRGYQPIRWIGSSRRPATGKFAPIRIRRGTLGNARDLLVSPQHRMLVSNWRVKMLVDEVEAFVPAKFLVNDGSIRRQEGGSVEYFHLLFDQHEIVYAEGVPSESYHPGIMSVDAFDLETREEIFALFPELRDGVEAYGKSARVTLKLHEVEVALGAL